MKDRPRDRPEAVSASDHGGPRSGTAAFALACTPAPIGAVLLMDDGAFIGPDPLARRHAAMPRHLD